MSDTSPGKTDETYWLVSNEQVQPEPENMTGGAGNLSELCGATLLPEMTHQLRPCSEPLPFACQRQIAAQQCGFAVTTGMFLNGSLINASSNNPELNAFELVEIREQASKKDDNDTWCFSCPSISAQGCEVLRSSSWEECFSEDQNRSLFATNEGWTTFRTSCYSVIERAMENEENTLSTISSVQPTELTQTSFVPLFVSTTEGNDATFESTCSPSSPCSTNNIFENTPTMSLHEEVSDQSSPSNPSGTITDANPSVTTTDHSFFEKSSFYETGTWNTVSSSPEGGTTDLVSSASKSGTSEISSFGLETHTNGYTETPNTFEEKSTVPTSDLTMGTNVFETDAPASSNSTLADEPGSTTLESSNVYGQSIFVGGIQLCQCSCSNITSDLNAQNKSLTELLGELETLVQNPSSSRRRKESAKDWRPSSVSVGMTATTVIGVIITALIVWDILSFCVR
ncbi:hypothetical protein PoB_003426800 [Plakobranchus ocellatus]|uniref:Uncharacterized protein n=1 Tax=Plakobranchus ocellatus TaxID=259542 RepID=A0AAV4AKE6_9GAST|nr:hypothetical protein PoB_003426800 [Plakobranchus ocellatus]